MKKCIHVINNMDFQLLIKVMTNLNSAFLPRCNVLFLYLKKENRDSDDQDKILVNVIHMYATAKIK